MVVLGVDPSTTSTGMVVLSAGIGLKTDAYYLFKPKARWSKYEKQLYLLERLEVVHREHQPDLVVIEGYGMNLKKPSAIIPLVELGGILRFYLHSAEQSAIAPQPAVWKQVLLGEKQGNASKDTIAAYLRAQGVQYGVQDLYDAHALAWLGLAFKGLISGLTAFQRGKLGEISML